MVILIFSCRVPKSLQTFKPIRELAAHFNSNRVIAIYMIYNIYKFQENQRTKNGSLSLTHFTHNQLRWPFQAVRKSAPESIAIGLGDQSHSAWAQHVQD